MERVVLDLKYAIRSLLRAPGFLLVAMLTLALGVGANTAIFSVVHGALLRPLPYPDDERLAVLDDSTTARAFVDWKSAAQSVTVIGGWRNGTFNLSGLGAPQRVVGAIVSDSFFNVLAVPAIYGRVIDVTDGPGGGRVAVLGHGLWERSFNADPAVVGRTIAVSGETVRIVGIMPANFEFPATAELWLSSKYAVPEHSLSPNVDPLSLRPSSYLWTAVRLKPGITLAAAAAERRAILSVGRPGAPVQTEGAEAGPSLIPLRERLFGSMRQPLLLLLLSVALLLLLACANIANLLLARATSRRPEMTVRAALGATRGMLVRQVMTEGFLLAVAGGLAGVVLAAWLLPLLLRIAPDGVRYVHADVGGVVTLVAMTAAIIAGVLAGLVPAIQASRASQEGGLSGGRIAGHAEARWARQVLVVAQVALSLVLLVAAGLLLRSFSQIVSVDPGFRAEGLLTFRIDLPTERYRTPQSQAMFYEAVLERLRGVRGVTSVAATTRLPFTTGESTRGIVAEGVPPRTNSGALFRVVSPDYFSVMDVPVVAGRALGSQDGAGGAPVAVINEAMARKFWPGESAVGRRFRITNEPASIEVIGVTRDMKHVDLREEQGAAYFLPLQQAPWSYMTIVMRTESGPADVASAVRVAVGEVDRDVPVPSLRSMNELMAGSLGLERFQLIVTGAFAILALALASLGLYGVMSYLVGRRRKEMAVRLALGAQPGSLVSLIMRDALVLVAIGCVAGAIAGALVARSLEGMLFGVAGTDFTAFAGAALLLTLVAALASYLPARRATLIDPARALRAD